MEEHILEFFYKWDHLEEQNGVDIIDFDFIVAGSDYPDAYSSREDALSVLNRLVADYQNISNYDPYIHSKLIASQYYLRALMGETIEYSDYVSHTIGVEPEAIPADILDQQRDNTAELYHTLGYSYTPGDFEKFRQEHTLTQQEVELTFDEAQKALVPRIMRWLGSDLTVEFRTQVVNLDEYWMNWISTDEEGKILLRFNIHPRNTWTRGFTEHLAMHEICTHAIQATFLKQQIREKKLSRLHGLTMVFCPEQFTMEGISDSLYRFYGQPVYSQFGELSANVIYLYWMTLQNAHIMANTGISDDQILAFLESYMPGYESVETRKKTIHDFRTSPFHRSYLYVYGSSTFFHTRLAERLTAEDRRAYVLDIFSRLYTSDLIRQKYAHK